MSNHEELTQKYSTWGDKLLQHTDVLHSIQVDKKFKPITVQLAPNEVCDSDCPFCSVAGRPLKSYIPFEKIVKLLKDFKQLGAKSLEITGGGNPLLYKDRESKQDINDIIDVAHSLGLEIGIITNSHDLKRLRLGIHSKLSWVRVSLIQLDEGRDPEDYNFRDVPYNKLGLSYIIYDSTEDNPNPLSRTKKDYLGTTPETIKRIGRLVKLHPDIKFVRIAGNCLIKGNNARVRDKFKGVVDEVDNLKKFFIKDIGYDDSPFEDGCYVGMTRPYVAPHPHGDNYQVYTCTSHVLNKRTYDLKYSLGSIDDIISIWRNCNENYKNLGYPYEIDNNKGCGWSDSCKYCYYKFNNKLLHTVANEMPDKNFP